MYNFTSHGNSGSFDKINGKSTLGRHYQNNQPSLSSTTPEAANTSANTPAPIAPAPTGVAPTVAETSINCNTKQKWIINLTNTPLTTVQESLLARGSNFAIVPKYPLKKHTLWPWKRLVPCSHPGRQMSLDLTPVAYLGTTVSLPNPTLLWMNVGP